MCIPRHRRLTLPAEVATTMEAESDILVTSSSDLSVRWTHLATGEVLRTFHVHKAPVLSVSFHPHLPHVMVTGAMDGGVALHNTLLGSPLMDAITSDDETGYHHDVDPAYFEPTAHAHQSWRHHTKYVTHVMFSSSGNLIATGSRDNSIHLYIQKTLVRPFPDVQALVMPSYSLGKRIDLASPVEALHFLPRIYQKFEDKETLVYAVTEDHHLTYCSIAKLADETLSTEDALFNMNGNGDDWVSFRVYHISVHPSAPLLLCSTNGPGGRLILFKLWSQDQVRNWYIPARLDAYSRPHHVWHPSGAFVFAAMDDGTVRVLHTLTGRVIHVSQNHKQQVRGIDMNPDGTRMAACSYDGSVSLWTWSTTKV